MDEHKPRIIIDDGELHTRLMLASYLGLAMSMPGCEIFHGRTRHEPNRFTWEEDSRPYSRTEDRKEKTKNNRMKKRSRKNRRGF